VEGDRERQPSSPLDPSPPTGEAPPPSAADVADEISRELLAIHRESYGGTAQRATAHVLGDTVIVLLDGLELLPNEEFLIESGNEEAVASFRSQHQKAIEPTFRAAVERATGRRVIGFASHVSIEEPRFMAEVFRLAPS
jgi:uncharacterized protein YbcI